VEARLSQAAGEGGAGAPLPANPSARYRAARLALFREVVTAGRLDGVLLAHHADDQAETVLHRLLRGSGYAGLAGMGRRANLRGLVILRPLLGVGRERLRACSREAGQAWREDESNASDEYLRNRLRRVLETFPQLTARLLELADACRAARDWARRASPALGETFLSGELRDLPPVLARESAARWLAACGVPPGGLSPEVIDRLRAMAADAATAPRQHFPGGLLIQRSRGSISRSVG
jgi:tRNA(Ile)-lysidine synthase